MPGHCECRPCLRPAAQQRGSIWSLGLPAWRGFCHDVPAAEVHASVQGAVATPAAAGAAPDPNPPAKTPWRTPPPVFDDAETPAAASGWQELCGADEDAEGAPSRPCCCNVRMTVLLEGKM